MNDNKLPEIHDKDSVGSIPEGNFVEMESIKQSLLEDSLDGQEKEEFRALYNEVSLIAPVDRADIRSQLTEMSLSDEEISIVERYYELKELAMERLSQDKM